MIFNILYGVLSVLVLTFAGCQKIDQKKELSMGVVGSCSSIPMEKPLESCSKSLDSLQVQAKLPHLKSTELTAGQLEYSSGEILIDRRTPTGERLRIHAIERVCKDEATGREQARMDIVCQESLEKQTEKIVINRFAPRMINVMRDERTADTFYRGAILETPGGTLAYRFEDGDLKLGVSRTDLQARLNKEFDDHYFIRQTADVYLFVGKKKLPNGSTDTIRMTFRKVSGNFSKDAFLFDPTPDAIFKL